MSKSKVKQKRIVIVGGGSAAMLASKCIADKLANNINLDVTVVAPNDEFWHNFAAAKLLVEPELIESSFFKIPELLKKRGHKFTKGTVIDVDLETKSISTDLNDTIEYDYLILASGAQSACKALKPQSDNIQTRKVLKETTESIKNAKSIAVIGGCPCGVELCGEIASTYKDKQITLYTRSEQPLKVLNPKRGVEAIKKLQSLNVNVVNNAHVDFVHSQNNKYKIITLNGNNTRISEKKPFDFVIPTFGVFPNTFYLDKNYLDARGFIKIDDYLRMQKVNDVYALGDVISGSTKSITDILFRQTSILTNTLRADMLNKPCAGKTYNPARPNRGMLVPISKHAGVGGFNKWKLPDFVVTKIKGDRYFLNRMKKVYT